MSRWAYTEYGAVAFAIWSPDGQEVAIVGLPAERRLRFVREDAAYRRNNGQTAGAEERRILEGRDANRAWAELIVDALNRAAPNLHQPQDERSGLRAIFGRWPGDETDEEIEAALAEMERCHSEGG